MDDSPASIACDIAAIARISVIPALLRIVCDNTGLRFAAVVRVTEGTWTACAVLDEIEFGLTPGSQLDIHSTLCKEVRVGGRVVAIDHASVDPVYSSHHTPRIYGIESYISVPILQPDGQYFGNLCAIDPLPGHVANPETITMFESFAELIGRQLDIERQQEETENALMNAMQTAELREQFIAVLGHDLRNPLASIGAIGEILARRPDLEVSTYGQRLRANTRRMSRLIDDVVDLARGRMGSGMDVRLEVVADFDVALRNVVSELRDAHADWTIEERYRLQGPLECDPGRVQQLVSNLLGNTLAYGSRDKPVTLDAALEDGWLSIAVTNGGEPIAPDSMARIFEPFWRPAHSEPGGGLGLGLHICLQIAQAHGGSLDVTSDRASGTCFVARLPARFAEGGPAH